jgi:ribosomal protein S15P/S13E
VVETEISQRYLELRIQFEKFTKRSLTEKELVFIRWLTEKGANVEEHKREEPKKRSKRRK